MLWCYGVKFCYAEFLRFYYITLSANENNWQPMAEKVLQYHGDSPDKPRVLIFAPTGIASINVNGITIHQALGIPCRGKFYPLDSKNITPLRNKFSDVFLAGKFVLVAGDLYQLPPVNAMPVYASLNSDELESYVGDVLWEMFSLVELTEVMRQKRGTSFIDLLNQI